MKNESKKLKQITLKEAEKKKYKLLGTGGGANLQHCMHEGILHCKDFEKRVKYYVIVSSIEFDSENKEDLLNKGKIMAVRFYE